MAFCYNKTNNTKRTCEVGRGGHVRGFVSNGFAQFCKRGGWVPRSSAHPVNPTFRQKAPLFCREEAFHDKRSFQSKKPTEIVNY